MNRIFAALAFLGLLALSLAGGIALDRVFLLDTSVRNPVSLGGGSAPAVIPDEAVPQFELMAQAWSLIREHYVNRSAIERQELAYGAIRGMMDTLADLEHSRFLTPQMAEQRRNLTGGEMEGIGVHVRMREGMVVIVAALDDSPAHQAGLELGDVIVEVNGTPTEGKSLDQVVDQVLGPAGTRVTLAILDEGTGQRREVTLTRARIELQNVAWRQLPGTEVAHLRIVAFSDGVTGSLREALSEIQEQGLESIILDLRNNPGGLLREAIGVASQFLEDGNVLLIQDGEGNVREVPVKGSALAPEIPMVVLINEGTASAAEIVSGALKDQGRAALVGQTTSGAGTVLNEFTLDDGSALLLAIKEWLTPDGHVIWHRGIEPDVVVALPEDASALLPQEQEGLTAAELRASNDTQLLRALELVTPSAADQGR